MRFCDLVLRRFRKTLEEERADRISPKQIHDFFGRQNGVCKRARYMPKIEPFKALAFNNPTPANRRFVLQEHQYDSRSTGPSLEEVRTDSLVLPNRNFDSGNITKAGEHSPADGPVK